MNLIQAVIMGLMQGLTEFLPVSSSGHLVLTSSLYKFFTNETLKIAYNGRFTHERVKKEDIMQRLHDKEIQKRIDEGFNPETPILTDSRTVQTLNELQMKRPKEKRLLDIEKDFSKYEQQLSFDRNLGERGIEKRENKNIKRVPQRNVSMWNSKWF